MGFLSDAVGLLRRRLVSGRLQDVPARPVARRRGGDRRRAVPATIGPYEVLQLLERDDELQLLKAWDAGRARWVRLAALRLEDGLDATERLRRMARLHRIADPLTAVRHESVLRVHGLEYHEGWGCVVMEQLEGVQLAELLAQSKTLSPSQVAPLGAALASVIAAAAEAGVEIVDLDPAEIMLTSRGEIKLCSLGRKGQTGDGGTSLGAANVSGLSNLGGLLYRCLTGRRPSLPSAAEKPTRRALTPISAYRPSVPADLERIIMGLMIFDTEEVRLSPPVVAGGLERLVKQHGWNWQTPESAASTEPPRFPSPEADGQEAIPA
jgi:serine/threonine protein kinase